MQGNRKEDYEGDHGEEESQTDYEGVHRDEEQGENAAMQGSDVEEVSTHVFAELHLSPQLAHEVQKTWLAFLNSQSSREAAGEAVYAAIFDSAPSLQSLFKTPRAVMAMRFTAGLADIISKLDKPAELKNAVSVLGFQHLDLDVTVRGCCSSEMPFWSFSRLNSART